MLYFFLLSKYFTLGNRILKDEFLIYRYNSGVESKVITKAMIKNFI